MQLLSVFKLDGKSKVVKCKELQGRGKNYIELSLLHCEGKSKAGVDQEECIANRYCATLNVELYGRVIRSVAGGMHYFAFRIVG